MSEEESRNNFNDENWVKRKEQAYDAIEKAYLRDELVLFVGSGISRRAGANDWNGFAKAIFDQLIDSKKVSVNHNLYNQIKHYSPRKRLSFAFELAAKSKVELDFKKAIIPKEESQKKDEANIYDYLNQLDCNVVTTNYDLMLNNKPKPSEILFPKIDGEDDSSIKGGKELIYERNDIHKDTLEKKKNKIVYLHGCFKNDNNDLVITTEHYLEHYKQEENNRVVDFIDHLFNDGLWTVLFLGYGLEEMEILEYLLRRNIDSETNEEGNKSGSKNYNRFWLEGYYTHQKEEMELISDYYQNNFDILLMPYLLDIKEYRQVDDEIRRLVKNLEIAKNATPEKLVELTKKVKGDG